MQKKNDLKEAANINTSTLAGKEDLSRLKA